MKRTIILALLIPGLCAGVFLIADMQPGKDSAVIAPAYAGPAVTAREQVIAGTSVGEVVMDGQVIFRIRTPAGGLSPFQRAQVVAQRLDLLTGDGLQVEDITTGRANSQDVVLAEGEVVITADTTHARLNQTTPMELAEQWAGNLESAVEGRPVAERPTAEKLVPIISVGDGTRIGGALVAGPSDKVADVKAVAQIEGTFGTAVRGRVLVPVSSEDVIQKISRVPQTSVTALVDIKL